MLDRFKTQALRSAPAPATVTPDGSAQPAAAVARPGPAHPSDRPVPRELASWPIPRRLGPASRAVVLAATLLALSGCQPRQTGMFSTLELDKDGLLYGYEIFIVKADRGASADHDYYAIVQCADGKAGPPSIGQVTMTADQVRIALPPHASPGCPSSTFVGTVGYQELAGHFVGGEPLALARKYSFWE